MKTKLTLLLPLAFALAVASCSHTPPQQGEKFAALPGVTDTPPAATPAPTELPATNEPPAVVTEANPPAPSAATTNAAAAMTEPPVVTEAPVIPTPVPAGS